MTGYFDYGYFDARIFDTERVTVIDETKAIFGRSNGGARAIGATRGGQISVTGRTR